MVISVITLFPHFFEPFISTTILKRAEKDKKISFNLVDLRQFGIGKHKVVDDKPYGGGKGMILRFDVLDKAITMTRSKSKNEKVVLLSPRGARFTQETAEQFSNLDHLILVTGHYEGVDERVGRIVDYEISIGDYILSGGEIGALVILDSVSRLVPGVLGTKESTQYESFAPGKMGRLLEYPQFTRPQVHNNLKVPNELLSGNFQVIEEWRQSQSKKLTKKRRPDLIK